MHRLIKIRIARDFEHLKERMRTWMDAGLEPGDPTVSFRPPADFYETSRGLVLRLEVAGVAKDDLSLMLAGQELIIRGRRRPPPPEEGILRFIHLEMGFGAFERSFYLPFPIDPNGVRALYLDGILEVHLPRRQPQSRRIPIKEVVKLD